jgi:cytochrome c biogenesis protein CcmG/thiol:disulfide interchange protein DsbE
VVSGAARLPLTAAVAVALAVATPRAASAQGDDVGLPLGTAAPAAVVQDLDGHPVDLASLVGRRPVVIEFWATWCPICAALMPRIEAAHRRFDDRVGFVEVAVGVNESRTSVRRHVETHHYPFTFLFDATGAAVRAYQAPTTSYLVVVNAAGRIVYTGTGADQDVDAMIGRALGG